MDGEIAPRLVAARRLVEAALREELVGTPVIATDAGFLRYVAVRIGSLAEECILAVFLTEDRLYIGSETYSGGRRGSVAIPVRRLVRRALELDARRLILAHNHPSGDPKPSRGDITATRELASLLHRLEIALDDHCIATRHTVTSMRLKGLL